MKFTNTFVVAAPIEDVWNTLMDVERVAPCMPGAEVIERTGEDTYKVAIKVRLGPISMQYRGQVEIVERDDDARRATMRAKAKEARGQGTADAHVHMSLDEQPDGTHATLETELQLLGKAAAMGQGVIVDVAAKLVETFAANLAAMLMGEGAPAEGAPAEASAREPTPVAAAPAPAESTLPVGEIAASVIAGRLAKPRALLLATAALALLFGAIGYAIGRTR